MFNLRTIGKLFKKKIVDNLENKTSFDFMAESSIRPKNLLRISK